MFDVGAGELLVIAIAAILVIGPKDMPMALRTAGRWIAKVRRVSGHFRSGLDAMIREAEMEEMDRKWRERNEAIMAKHPQADFHPEEEMQPLPAPDAALSAAEAKAAYKAEAAPPGPSSSVPDNPAAPDDKKG
jgi:sec-independent protein translocase protein TatB